MKIHFLTGNALEALRTNISSNINHYSDTTNQWIYDYFGDEQPFMEYKQEFSDFDLNYDEEKGIGQCDIENTIKLYSSMKSLTDTQASDERLWAGMCHCDFWNYLNKRLNSSNNKTSFIKSRYFFGQNKKRSLITNSLSKLWWLGRLTYDEQYNDKFHLTKYFKKDYTTKTFIVLSNNYISNFTITKGLITALQKLEDEEYFIRNAQPREVYYEATRYLNVLGGTYILDYFSSEEICEKVVNYMENLSDATYKIKVASM